MKVNLIKFTFISIRYTYNSQNQNKYIHRCCINSIKTSTFSSMVWPFFSCVTNISRKKHYFIYTRHITLLTCPMGCPFLIVMLKIIVVRSKFAMVLR